MIAGKELPSLEELDRRKDELFPSSRDDSCDELAPCPKKPKVAKQPVVESKSSDSERNSSSSTSDDSSSSD